MIDDLDFAQTELQMRGVNLECFMQQNPLLIRPNQKLGRVLAAHSIIMEMVEFAKVLTPTELLALSSRIRDSDRTERQSDAVASKPILGVAQLGADVLLERDCGTERSSTRGEASTDRENNNHEDCAAELVNILDENLDFILARPSREPNLPREELAGRNNNFGVEDRNEEEETTLNEDTPADEFEGSAQGVDAFPSRLGSAAMEAPMDNQSDYEDNSGDEGDDGEDLNNDPDPVTPQLPQAPVAMVVSPANADHGKEQGSHPLLVDSALTNEDPANLPSLGGVAASDHDQNSARTEGSNNQSEYDNSFDDDAGVNDPPQELGVDALPENATSGVAPSEQKGSDEPDESVEGEDKDGLLDENEADAEKTLAEPATSSEQPLSSRSDSNGQSDYDNSFDDDADEEDDHTEVDPVASQLPSDSTTGATATIGKQEGGEDVGGSNDPSIHDTKHGDHPPQINTELPVPETDDSPRSLSNKLVDELQRWSLLQDVARPTESEVQRCLSWHKTLPLAMALQSDSPIADAMESSLISMLGQYELAVPQQPLRSLLGSDVALELELAKCLGEECRSIVDEICSVLAEDMQRSLGRQNSLVSEIELTDVVEIAQTTRQEQQESTWKCLKSAMTLVAFLRTCATEGSISIQSRFAPSAGFSRLLKVFYPYLVNQPREKLHANWLAVSKELGAMGLNIEELSFLLDPVCKALLLTVHSADAFSHEASGSDDPESSVISPKITVVCAREDVLQSSVEYVSRKGLLTDGAPSSVSLFPFFKSSFGEKLVDGVKVEEGEGKGPLKEWFSLVGLQMASKWKRISLDSFVQEEPSDQITVSGNAITVPGVAHLISPGFQLEWEGSDGETVARVVNKGVEESTFLLDRGVDLSQSFPASQLRVSQPRTALFEYLQASESYWPNEQTRDSPENRNTLVFVGWFLANAISHYSSIQLPIHPLFFRLLLHPQYRVTLADLQAFNSSLFESLLQLKEMKPADFEAYLKFEGADAGLSVAAYITQVLEDKFGSASGAGWQLEAVRQGFTRVVPLEQIRGLGIDAEDLVDIVCGGSSSRGSHDFAINEVFRVAADSDFSDCQPLTNAFWQTVDGFDPLLKRKFIKFVTGVDTLPLAGTEVRAREVGSVGFALVEC
ncbi:hypothetical protein BBJ28_00006872 [Nothophytophthora sp. Chile5]|nr:hypothetical protein BBJ28_00006872 [Nothophytophthora sp. Chile5]